jgi:cytochrome b subunit of formate dehydrogenase
MGCHDGMIDTTAPEDRKMMVDAVPPDWKPSGPKSDPKRAGVALKVDLEKMKKSVHGAECLNCHTDIAKLSHAAKLQPANCGSCHGDADAAYKKSAHFQAAGRGNAYAPTCADCHGAHDILNASDPNARTNREKIGPMCGQCHAAGKMPGATDEQSYDQWALSVHAQKKDGKKTNATCSDCHNSHEAAYATGPTAKLSVAATCGKCHKQAQSDFELGIHGTALARGNWSSPTCTDCHGTHNVRAVHDPDAQVYGYKGVENVCGECHKAERINSRFRIRSTTKSYEDSFHGLALAKGDVRAAGCASCHGPHAILPSHDRRSAVHADNLVATCGKCHPGIGAGAAHGKVHPSLSRTAGTIGEKISFWVRWVYLGLIPGVLGFMFLHNLVDWIKKIRVHLQRMRAMGEYERLSRNERLQHILLMVSFSLLVISGFALTFGWKIPGISGELNETIRAYTHRIAALMMIAWAAYHAYWVVMTKRGRRYVIDMMPRLKDAYDMVYQISYNVGVWPEKPKFDRFSYIEKAEYLAMVWGTAVMVGTGLILWFEEPVLRVLPLWAIDVSNIIHYMEAILATLAIIIWHFYSVLFNPDVAPMATHWLTGTLTEEQMEHEHPLELERIKAGQKVREEKRTSQDDENMQG